MQTFPALPSRLLENPGWLEIFGVDGESGNHRMRLVLQRVTSASVTVSGTVTASIGHGVVVLAGISSGEQVDAKEWALRKILNTRLWEDDSGKAWAKGVSQAGLEVPTPSNAHPMGAR